MQKRHVYFVHNLNKLQQVKLSALWIAAGKCRMVHLPAGRNVFFRMVTNLIIFIVSFPKSSLSHPLDSQVYFIVVHF